MGKKRKRTQLTQEEVWDDSALLRSWQDALEEYQLYHSIHAKGGNIEDVLRQAEDYETLEDETIRPAQTERDEIEDGEVDENEGTSEKAEAASSYLEHGGPSSQAHQSYLREHEESVEASASMKPNQILENIKMAYWWAGYYSGLYDAQEAAQKAPHDPNGPV